MLTLTGRSFASRVATSLNSASVRGAIFSVDSRREFVDVTVGYLSNKRRIESNFPFSTESSFRYGGLFNSSDFAHKVEYAYAAMHEIRRLSSESRHIFFASQ